MSNKRETAIDFMSDENFMTIYTCEKKYIRRLEKLKEEYPNKVKITQHEDNCISVKCPKAWFRFPKPKKKVNLTEEQRKVAADRMRAVRESAKR